MHGGSVKARWTRIALLALMLLALSPGATLAVCLQAESGECCCHDACPRPGEARLDAASCCEMSDGGTLPPTVPAVVAPATTGPEPAHAVEIFDATVDAPARVHAMEVRARPAVHRPVALFTLHAAFLI
jgi:hypothetical protein